MPGYGIPQRGRTAAEGAVDVVPSAGGRPRTASLPPQQAQQMGPDTGFMPQGPGMPQPQQGVPIAGGMPMGQGQQGDPMAMLIQALMRQAGAGQRQNPFLDFLRERGLLGG